MEEIGYRTGWSEREWPYCKWGADGRDGIGIAIIGAVEIGSN
jgi:hypothetical protein